jgi:hypothetical protein
MKRIPLTISIILLLCFYANAQSPIDRGSVQDGTYINNGFGFTYTYPKDWTVHGDATNERIKEAGKQELVASGGLSKGTVEASMKNTHYLLTVFRHPLGTPGITFNPAVMIIAERVDHAPGIKNGKDYVLNTRAILKRTGAQVPDEEPTEHRFAGWQFFGDSYALEINGVPVIQSHFATIVKGYALLFIFMGPDQKSVDEIAKSMETVTLVVPSVRRGVTTVIGTEPKPRPKPN